MENIVVGTDRSAPSVEATRWALELARHTHASVRAVEAFRTASIEISPSDLDAEIAERTETLRAWARTHRLSPVSVAAVPGPPVPVIVGQTAARTSDLVVIGSTGTSGVTRWALGGTAHGLSHQLAVPLAVVPAGTAASSLAGATIVVGVDGSEGSAVALAWCAQLADRLDGSVVAFSSVPGVFDTFDSEGWYGREEQEARDEVARTGSSRVTFAEDFSHDPARALNAAVRRYDAAMVVAAARDRHSLGGTLLGPVVDKLIHHPAYPTVVITHEYIAAHRADVADRIVLGRPIAGA